MRLPDRCLAAPTTLLLAVLLLSSPTGAVEVGPQGVVRQFCQLDGLGQRVSVPGWPQIAPLVSWSLEPAWDHVVLISGYSVGAPKPGASGTFTMDVIYNDVGQVSAFGLETSVQLETVTFEVQAMQAGGWRINGPPPPPHIFADRADIEMMQASFEAGGLNFLPNTLFVWRMFRSAGWNVPVERTLDLLSGPAYRAVEQPAVGDVVIYLRDGSPYHAGLLESENQVVSSTLNSGVMRTSIGAFAGEVKYLRLVKPDPLPTSVPASLTPVVTAPAAQATPKAPAIQHSRTPTPRAAKRKPKPRRARKRPTRLSHPKHAKKKGGTTSQHVTRRPTPGATR